MTMTFQAAVSVAMQSLGLTHYHVTVEEFEEDGYYAESIIDAANCIATIRWNRKRCEDDGVVAETALHEALHVMLADLTHAVSNGHRSAMIEEERIVRRLETILAKGVFPHSPSSTGWAGGAG